MAGLYKIRSARHVCYGESTYRVFTEKYHDSIVTENANVRLVMEEVHCKTLFLGGIRQCS